MLNVQKKLSHFVSLLILTAIFYSIAACGSDKSKSDSSGIKQIAVDPMKNKGIGPIDSVTLGTFDPEMAEQGEAIYQEKCTVCHKPEENYLGPAPKGILDRRRPEWVMNMILNPTEMIKHDPIAKELLKEFNNYPMTNQNLSEEEARKVLEYFRSL